MNDFKINMMQILKSDGDHEIPDFLQTLEERDPEEVAYSEIDAKIEGVVESGLLILNGYQYLVGSLLSFNILDKVKREDTNEIMIDITNQLGNQSIDNIVQLFGINLCSNENSTREKGYQKKLVPDSTNDN